jgi:hypothetical protein
VNPTGVVINSSGVHPGSAESWNLRFVSNSSDNPEWLNNINADGEGANFNYQETGTPGPALCRALWSEQSYPVEYTVQVGERDCYIDLNGVVGYWQVISVGQNTATITAWFWDGPPPS